MRCLHETLYAVQWVRSPPDPDQLGNPFLNHPNRFNTAHMSAAGNSILTGLQDALAYAQGNTTRGQPPTVHVPATVDVKAVRTRLGLTQAAFAQRYGFELSSIRNWEQGRRQPEGPARILLLVIDKEPEAVHRALAS